MMKAKFLTYLCAVAMAVAGADLRADDTRDGALIYIGETATLPQGTRVIPRHVHDNRQNTTNVRIPRGYRAVWQDERLNSERAVMTLRPSVAHPEGRLPAGYIRAWDDNRLNPKRGLGNLRGEEQANRIWTQTVPRTLVHVPTNGRIATWSEPRQDRYPPFWKPRQRGQSVTRLSTRSGQDPLSVRADR